jgi:DNA-binding phage protein
VEVLKGDNKKILIKLNYYGKSTKIGSNLRRQYMALTRDFKKSVLERAQRDPAFKNGLLEEAINEFLSGNVEVGKELMRDYINATIAFPTLANKLHKSDKSLQRMFGPHGNPTMSNFCAILKAVQKKEGFKLKAQVRKGRAVGEN